MVPPVLFLEFLTIFIRNSPRQNNQRLIAERVLALRPLGSQGRQFLVFEGIDACGDMP